MKNKFVKIFSFSIICFLLAISFSLNKFSVFAEEPLPPIENTVVEIDDKTDFKNTVKETGEYILKSNITITGSNYEDIIPLFKGKFNGNGYTIFLNGLCSIFGTIENADIKNIKIVYSNQIKETKPDVENPEIVEKASTTKNTKEVGTEPEKPQEPGGETENPKEPGVEPEKPQEPEKKEGLKTNFGLLAKNSNNSNVNTIECDFSIKEIKKEIVNEGTKETTQVLSENILASDNVSVGTLIGKVNKGNLSNLVILSSFKVEQNKKDAIFTNVGGVVGYLQSANLYNVISYSNIALNHTENIYTTRLSLGGVCGFFEGKTSHFSNVVVDGTLLGFEGDNIGAFVGMFTDIQAQLPLKENNFICGLVSLFKGNIKAVGLNNYLDKNVHFKLAMPREEFKRINTYKTFQNEDDGTSFWDVVNMWDTNYIWQEKIERFSTGEVDERYLTVLQCFETYKIKVNSNPSVYNGTDILELSILSSKPNIENKPKSKGLTYKATEEVDTSKEKSVRYGEEFYIQAKFNNILGEDGNPIKLKVSDKETKDVKYDVFFMPSGLKFENAVEGIKDIPFDENTLTWTIPFAKFNTEGTYIVELEKLTYNLLATNYNEGMDSEGKLGKSTNSVKYDELELLFSYGEQNPIIFHSFANSQFAGNGYDFYPTKDFTEESRKPIDLEKIKTCTTNMFSFSFNEKDKFTLEYLLPNVDFNNPKFRHEESSDKMPPPVAYINALFTSKMCYLNFNIELDGKTTNKTFGTKISVKNETLKEKNGTFKYNAVIGDTVSIRLSELPIEKYEFVTIKDSYGEEYLLDGETDFEYLVEEKEDVTFTLCFKSIDIKKRSNLIWWIVGGVGGGLIAIITCWIVIVKLKDRSYKNMYNKF